MCGLSCCLRGFVDWFVVCVLLWCWFVCVFGCVVLVFCCVCVLFWWGLGVLCVCVLCVCCVCVVCVLCVCDVHEGGASADTTDAPWPPDPHSAASSSRSACQHVGTAAQSRDCISRCLGVSQRH